MYTHLNVRKGARLFQNVKIKILVGRLNRLLSQLPIEVGVIIKNLLNFDN
jgi:hypothetical protein